MASPWQNIISSPEFSAMSPEEKQQTRNVFFDKVIAPEAGDDGVLLNEARGNFYSKYDFMPKPQPEQEPGAMGAFLQSAKHEAGSGLGGGIGGALGAMGAGALAGASSGSVVPGWGTLAGGIVGALAGGFLGKKAQQAIQGKEAYEKEAQELAKVAEQHPIATSTGALLPALPTMMLAPGAGAITKIAGIGDEVTNIAAQAIRRASPQLTDDAVKMAANSFRLMKPADAVKYAQSLGLGDDAANAIQNAAVSTAQRLGGQALESGVQMGIMAGGESAAQVAEGNKSIADIPGDILKGTVTGAPLGLMGPVALGKGKLGSALGGALIKGPVDAALMATGEEAYDAATGKSDGFSLQRAGERAVGMLPSFSLLAGGMGVFHGKPEFKKPPELKPQEADTSLLPELAKPESIQEHEAIQNYLRAKESGNPDELARATDELAKVREAAIPQPTPLEKAAAQTENAGSSPVLTEALKTVSANLDAQKAAEMDRRLSQMEDEGLLADVISAEREKALQRQEAEAAKQREEQYQKLKEQQNAIQERPAEEVFSREPEEAGIPGGEREGVGPIEQGIETTPEENRELGEEKIDLTEGEQRNRDILQEAANKLKGLQKAPEIPSVFPETIPAPSEGQVRVKELNKEVEVAQPQVDIGGMKRDASKPEQMTLSEFESNLRRPNKAPNIFFNVPTPNGSIIGETIGSLKGVHRGLVSRAIENRLPVSVDAANEYGWDMPDGYVQQGDLYVFRPENTAAPEGGPIPRGGVNEFPETQREDRPAVVEEQITPEVTESTREITPEARALISLNEFISTIKNEKGRASWTPEVIAKAQKFFQSHDVNDLAGLNKVQSSRIKEIERQSFPEIQKQVRAEERNLAKREREDELFAKEIPKERAEEPVEEVFSDEDMDNLSAQIRKDLDAEGLRPSIAGGEEKIPAEAKASSDLIAARGNFEEAQRAFNEAHQPIPIAEATPERIDSILARRKQTAESFEAAKTKLKYEAVKDLTKHLPWEQRTKEMEGITDTDTLEKHKQSVKEAAAQRKPVSIEAAKEYGIKLDSDYQADRFGIARPTLDRRIQPFKEYGERGAITSEKVSPEQVREAIKSLPAEVRRMLEKSGFDIISREEASKLDGITPEFAAKAEGFFYNGKIYVIPENIKVTTKDVSALKAAARVLVHENLHEAFNAVVAKDPKAMEEWKGMLKQIPENDLEALARDYQKGDDWRRDPKAVTDLAEEWLAKKWEDYQGGKMVEAEKPIFERILNSIRKIIERVFGGIRQFKTQDEDLEAFFDKLSKNRLRVKGGDGEVGGKLKPSYAGEESLKNMDEEKRSMMKDSLETAKAMAAAGKSSEEIRAVTGWFPGKYDGKMRYEVPDCNAKLKKGWEGAATLGDVIDHPELFSVYPQAKNINIHALIADRAKHPAINGHFDPRINSIAMGAPSKRQLISGLLHEVQHWVQEKEGFAEGQSEIGMSNAIKEADRIPNTPEARKFWGDAKVNAAVKLREAVSPFDKKRAYKLYLRAAGEIESRDIQARQNFTDEQRKATAPYSSENIAPDDAIVMFGRGTKASLPADEAAEKERLEKMPVTPEMNAKYMEAVKNGDMETAQRMVDEAAKRAGHNVKAFHGGDAQNKRLPWFTEDLSEAEKYGEAKPYYLRVEHPVDVIGGFLPQKLMDEGYDSAKIENPMSKEGNYGGQKPQWIPLDKAQIKSADPVTYDNQGNPIPLSERFNPESPDIRFSIPTSEEAERERQFGKNLFGISMEALEKQAAELDLPPLERAKLDLPSGLFEKIKAEMLTDKDMGKRAVDRILSGEGGLATQNEEIAMALENARLAKQLTTLDDRLSEPGISRLDSESILNQIDDIKTQINRTMQALYESGTKLSRAFYARQLAFNNKYELQNIYQRARRAKGGAKLTKEEEGKIFSQAERILKDTEAFDKLEREKDKLKIPDLIDLISKQVDEIKATGQKLGDEGAAVLRETPPTPGLRGFDLAYESLAEFSQKTVDQLDDYMLSLNQLLSERAKRKSTPTEAKASFAQSELSSLSDAELDARITEFKTKVESTSKKLAAATGIETKSKEPKTILDEAKAKIESLRSGPKGAKEKTPLQKLLDEHREIRMGSDKFVKKAEEIGLEKDTALELYQAFNQKNGVNAQELPDSVYGRLMRKFVEEGERSADAIADKISKWLGGNGYGEIPKADVMDRIAGYSKKTIPDANEINKRIKEIKAEMRDKLKINELEDKSAERQYSESRDLLIDALEAKRAEIASGKDADAKEFSRLGEIVNSLYGLPSKKWNKNLEAKLRKELRGASDAQKELLQQMIDAVDPELKFSAKDKAIQSALNNRLKYLESIRDNAQELRQKSEVEYPPYFKEILDSIAELKKAGEKGVREKQLGEAIRKADEAIAAHDANLPPEVKPKRFESIDEEFFKKEKEDLKNKRYTRLLQSQERKWKKKLADQDFAPKKKEQRALDDKQKEIKRRIEETKEEIEKTIKDLQFEQLSPLEKAGEYLVRWKRYAILSSPISVFKLTSAAMTRAGTMGIENYMRTPFDILFPKAAGELRKIGVLESRATSKEYADAIAKGLSDGMRDAADTLKKGQSEIDAKYGKKNMDKEGWTNFFGRLHGMLKAPVKRSAFELAMSKQIRGFMVEKGREPSPDELLPMQMRAYEWANRQIFMNDNAITSAWNSSLNTLEQKGYKNLASLARFMLPIVKVPTNIAKETLQYTPLGIAKGTYDMMNVVRAGLESIKDKPEIAESILRNFNKGFIGTGLMMLGYAMPQIAGGFYEKGEKRHEDEPDFGEMMIGGVRIPKWMLHAPFFEVIQLGSTMRRAVDHSMEKHGERDYAEGAVSGLKGVLDELPFIAEMGRVSDAFDNQKSRNRFLGDLAASAIIPAAVGYTARKSDTEAPEGAGLIERLSAPTVKRETVGETLGETIKKSVQAQVPGLREQLLPRVDSPFGPGIKVPKPLQDWERAGHPMPSVSTRVDFEKGYGKISDARWMTYVSTRGRAIRQAMAEKLPQLMSMQEEDKRRAIQQITKHASSEARKAIGLSA